jgi:deoxyribodipyrimidine photolyase-related protein
VFEHFITDVLDTFGDYQDAMATEQPFLWHGLISTALNMGLLLPLEVCRRIAEGYEAGPGAAERLRGVHPADPGLARVRARNLLAAHAEYGLRNALDADRRLPWFYWSGETRSACINDVVETTRRHAYAHHIQRLMVTGQFAMLLGVHPDGIDEWYLAVYADAYEWVEMPNTRGMATYADGGIMGTKPYAGSGAYINKMSDYCGRCSYDVKQRTGPDACPFNVLYWDFFMRHEGRLRSNRRVGYAYTTLSAGRRSIGERYGKRPSVGGELTAPRTLSLRRSGRLRGKARTGRPSGRGPPRRARKPTR